MNASEEKTGGVCPETEGCRFSEQPVQRKLEQLIDGARRVFLAQGFAGASVDDIAREAGISKATMYRYFPDKAAIFSEIIRRDCDRQSDMMSKEPGTGPLEPFLTAHAIKYVRLMTSPFMQGMYRAAVAESARVPEYGLSFYESGPDKGRRWLAPVLQAAAERGEIAVENADTSAQQFFALCSAEVFNRSLFGVVEKFTDAELKGYAETAVRTFLRAHAVTGSGADRDT